MPSGDAVEDAIRQVLASEKGVLLGYLFGSAATGRMGPLSDIDVAVLVDEGEVAAGRIEDALCRALGTDRIDLVVLNRAPSPLAYRVIKHGRLLYSAGNLVKEGFESRTVMDYLDFQPVRENAFRAAQREVLGVP